MIPISLPPNQQLVSRPKWPVVGEKQPRVDESPWTISTTGLVQAEVVLSLDQLREMPQVDRVIDVHCVTRWSRPQMEFRGVPLNAVLDPASVDAAAQFVSFVARSERSHSTSLPLAYLREADALIALEAEGQEIPAIHGGPVRMVVPGKYFYKSVKWLERIELLAEDRLGFWESDMGYHNNADPWREERFVAAGISKQAAAKLIEQRDFRDQNLLSIDASNRDLSGLLASGSALRNADFRRANLRGANFSHANLSGARLGDADLRGANLVDADVEGADFSGANLVGADFTGASLFGASFRPEDGVSGPAAVLDSTTEFSTESLDALTDYQREFVQHARRS